MSGIDKYRQLLLSLFPRGRAWNKEKGGLLFETGEGMGVEFTRVEGRAGDLLNELDPRTTFELLENWERVLGIPDECQDIAGTIQERIDAVFLKLTKRGGNTMSKQFFIDLAASVGYTITIQEPGVNLFRAGISRAGDRLYGALWKYWFQVYTSTYVLGVFRAGQNMAGDRLRTFENSALECVIERAKPSHTNVQFFYGS